MKNQKPAPEIIGDYIHVRVRDPNLFKEDTYRTFDISIKDGIKAVGGKLKNPTEGQEGSIVIQKYLFLKDKWSVAEALAWVKEHGKYVEDKMIKLCNSEDLRIMNDNSGTIIGTKETPAIKICDIAELKTISEKDGVVILQGYANTKNKADRYGDIPVVFDKVRNYVYDLTEFIKNPVMLLDHTNRVEAIAGSFTEIIEDEVGLRFTAKFSNSELPTIKHAKTVYLEGHGKALSIAGRWHYEDKDNPKHLTMAEIYHIALVGVGADPDALGFAIVVKPKKDLPKNDRYDKLELGLVLVRDALKKALLRVKISELGEVLSQARKKVMTEVK